MGKKFDIIVLGSGPGGYVAAGRAAQLGMKTALIERAELGGVCLNWGCIPTKALLESSHAWKILQETKKYGLKCENPSIDFPAVIARSRSIAERMSKGVGYLMKNRGVTVIRGTGYINKSENNSVFLNVTNDGETQMLETGHLIIATGGHPMALPGTPFDGLKILNSTHAMTQKERPGSVIIIGAGAIGMEFASFYRSLGAEVTVVEMMSQVLPAEDEDIVKELNRSLRRQKLKIMTNTKVTAVEHSDAGIIVTVSSSKGDKKIEAEKLIVAIGVQPNTKNIGLENTKVHCERGFVKVDETGQTNASGIYAIGDVTGPPLLAHKASAQAIICVDFIAGMDPHPLDLDLIPGCTYCNPQVASIGLTEKQAREKGHNVKTGTFQFRANGRSIAMNETEGIVKLVFDGDEKNKLLGAHILHALASELIAELGVVMTMGVGAESIARTIHAHPTLSEAVMEAAEDALGRPIHK